MSDVTVIIIALAVFAAATFGMGAFISVILTKLNRKEWFPEQRPTKIKLNIRESSEYDVMIAKKLFKIKQIAEADKITLSRFHNGGNFCNGFAMKRYTVTHETPYGSKMPLQDVQRSILISRYPTAMLTLATFGSWIVHDVNDCTDPNFKKDMEYFGFGATYLILIKQYDGSEEGFIGLNWKTSHVLEESKNEEIKSIIPTLLGLMNMQKEHLTEEIK